MQQLISVIVPFEALGKREYETLVSEVIDQTFSALGENVKNAVYQTLKSQYGVEKQDVADRLDAFAAAIENLFGKASNLIELRIIQALNSKVKGFAYKPKTDTLVFVQYMTALKKHMAQ
jgi:hypothetical protein